MYLNNMKKTALDSQDTLEIHKQIINNKYILNKTYVDFYERFKNVQVPKGQAIELGSGAGFIKSFLPNVITSDVVAGPGIDKVFTASSIPYRTGSVSVFYLLNVFHHIKNPAKALAEMQRCLKFGGKIVMIEPSNTVWARYIYTNFHHEYFDPTASWYTKGKGRLSDANGALPWILFKRDRHIFENKFPNLNINNTQLFCPFTYLLSGGLSKPQLFPNFTYPLLKRVEDVLKPLNSYLGMFMYIELEKS